MEAAFMRLKLKNEKRRMQVRYEDACGTAKLLLYSYSEPVAEIFRRDGALVYRCPARYGLDGEVAAKGGFTNTTKRHVRLFKKIFCVPYAHEDAQRRRQQAYEECFPLKGNELRVDPRYLLQRPLRDFISVCPWHVEMDTQARWCFNYGFEGEASGSGEADLKLWEPIRRSVWPDKEEQGEAEA